MIIVGILKRLSLPPGHESERPPAPLSVVHLLVLVLHLVHRYIFVFLYVSVIDLHLVHYCYCIFISVIDDDYDLLDLEWVQIFKSVIKMEIIFS